MQPLFKIEISVVIKFRYRILVYLWDDIEADENYHFKFVGLFTRHNV